MRNCRAPKQFWVSSPHTVAAYRDAWRFLLRFIHARTGKEPAQLDLADLGAPVISAFLERLEQERRNSVRTRNARLAAIHSFFHYAALRHPRARRAHRAGPGHPA
jgi:integrase/recombinase XerD